MEEMESAVAVVRRIVCSLLILLGILAAPPAATAQEKIRLGLLPFSESLGAVIAERQGFFKAEGLDVEVTKFESGALAVPVLQSGRIDIAFSNTVSTLQAIEQGLDAILLAPGAVVRSSPPDTTTALIVRKGTVSTLKDLEGKRVAVNVINSSAWLHAVAALEKHGVDRTKVSTAPNSDITQYIALAPWVEKNRATAEKFARAVIKGAQFANANEAATRDINQQFTGLNPALKDTVLLPRLGTAVNVGETTRTMELMRKYGLLKTPIDISRRVLMVP